MKNILKFVAVIMVGALMAVAQAQTVPANSASGAYTASAVIDLSQMATTSQLSTLSAIACPSGKVLSGGVCVALSGTGWSNFFAGSTHCGVVNDDPSISWTDPAIRNVSDGRNFCFVFESDGSISVYGQSIWDYVWASQGIGSGCTFDASNPSTFLPGLNCAVAALQAYYPYNYATTPDWAVGSYLFGVPTYMSIGTPTANNPASMVSHTTQSCGRNGCTTVGTAVSWYFAPIGSVTNGSLTGYKFCYNSTATNPRCYSFAH